MWWRSAGEVCAPNRAPSGSLSPRPSGALLTSTAARSALVLALAVGACRWDMHDQPRYEPNEASGFFPNGQANLPGVPGTVARGELELTQPLYTGTEGNQPLADIPVPVDTALLSRGRERYAIYCVPCHDVLGTGRGRVVQRGFQPPPSFHIDRLRTAPPGHLYAVITKGFGAMFGYGERVNGADAWAVVAYLRALQLSQHAKVDDLSDLDRKELEGAQENQP